MTVELGQNVNSLASFRATYPWKHVFVAIGIVDVGLPKRNEQVVYWSVAIGYSFVL